MTPDDRAGPVCDRILKAVAEAFADENAEPEKHLAHKLIAGAIRDAIAEEREECAKICDAKEREHYKAMGEIAELTEREIDEIAYGWRSGGRTTAKNLAKAIRARAPAPSQQPSETAPSQPPADGTNPAKE